MLLKNVDTPKEKCLITIAFSFLLIAIGFIVYPSFKEDLYQISYEYINTKDMAVSNVSLKQDHSSILGNLTAQSSTNGMLQETSFPVRNHTIPTLAVPKKIWYLPVENGVITTYPSYSHFAYDITSSRGSNENIFPIANGVISGIYYDSAGAKIVTVYHRINNINYTSQYVHLASYAPNLYVGKAVTINDSLGKMGRTGIATGVHLHIALVDCKLFDSNDPNCPDLNGFFRYGKVRYNQGFRGLSSVIQVPYSWTSR